MPNGEISQIQLPNGDLYDIRDGNVSDFKTNIDEETLSDGQILKYNEDAGEWENVDEIDPTDITNTASGTIASFSDGGDNIPVKSFECEIVAQQASGTPTPANPLSIIGVSEADIGDVSDATNITYFKGVLEGKYGFVDLSSLSWSYQSAGERFVSSGIASTVKAPASNDDVANVKCSILQTTYANNTSAGGLDNSIGITSTSKNIAIKATGAGTTQAGLVAFLSGCGFIYELDTPTTPTITPEQFASLCNAFGITGNAYIVEFGQTIYGGRLIYSNGQWAIEATQEILILDGTENISVVGSGTNRRFRFDDTFTYTAIPLSSHFIKGISNINPWGYYRFVSGYLILNDNNEQMADETALKTWLANQYSGGTPVQLLCELATPTIIPITSATRVKTISGLNNIFSNTGDVELEYFTEKADEIAELVEEEIASMSADYHAYSTDEQIVGRWIDGNTIYEKTFTATFTNIAQGTPQNMTDVSGLGIADVIRVFGSCKYDSTTPSVQPTLYESLGGHFFCYVYPSGYLQFGQTMTSQTTGRTYKVKVTIQYTKTSSNTRSLNLSKGSSEELPIEEKKEELKEPEEVKEVQDE